MDFSQNKATENIKVFQGLLINDLLTFNFQVLLIFVNYCIGSEF